MSILVLAHVADNRLSSATNNVVQAAQMIGGDIHVLVLGNDSQTVSEDAAKISGVSKVIRAEIAGSNQARPEQVSKLILAIADQYDFILSAANAVGKATLPRVAATLDISQISEITKVISPTQFERPIYAGNALETVETAQPKNVITVRTTSFDPVPNEETAEIVALDLDVASARETFLKSHQDASGRPKLDEANIVVSGGISLGSQQGFQDLIFPLADKLGAAVGASRAAVDAGYIANETQVGQTGKVVAPDLYIACGISGAIQHVAGMRASKVIVAINSDPEAPIMQLADFSLQGDIFELLPELTQKI